MLVFEYLVLPGQTRAALLCDYDQHDVGRLPAVQMLARASIEGVPCPRPWLSTINASSVESGRYSRQHEAGRQSILDVRSLSPNGTYYAGDTIY